MMSVDFPLGLIEVSFSCVTISSLTNLLPNQHQPFSLRVLIQIEVKVHKQRKYSASCNFHSIGTVRVNSVNVNAIFLSSMPSF